jgi:hypothetical protein
MKQMLKLAVISAALMVNFGAACAQNKPNRKPEDGERNAFETPTAGKEKCPRKQQRPAPGCQSGEPDERQSPAARPGRRAEYGAK